ncbi:MAG: hypothetical protein OEM49_10610 [Myxococcales bacterium]|nr:hypothetical protein [Myxococcales bacterium]MDH5566913.1 hypothetical protein [Myxococcales bacterium]
MAVEDASQLVVFLSGTSYIAVGIYLLQKAAKTRGRPEFYLGLAFLCNGISYAFSELPFVANLESRIEEFSYLGRIWAGGCAFTIALFTWRVFRSHAAWARGLVAGTAALIVAGLAVSALEGDWEGLTPLTHVGFWLDWAGGIAPFLWLSIEASRQYRVARRRIALGLIDPLVCNRFLLIAIYATLASTTYLLLIPMYIVYEIHGTWSAGLNLSLGLLEIASLIALTISFYVPAFYRRWIGGTEREAPPAA